MIRRVFATLVLSGSLAWWPVVAAASTVGSPAILAPDFDARVTTIGHRLAVASLGLCRQTQWHPGFLLHHLVQYRGGEQRAIETYGPLDRGPAVLALAASGPAERAGLRPGDVLLAVDGARLPDPQGSRFEAVEPLLEAIEAGFGDGRADLLVYRAGRELVVPVAAEQGCTTRFQVISGRSPDARADGLYVQLQDGLARYVRDDGELAAVIAHELAHNILRHKDRLDSMGVKRGWAGSVGRNAVAIRETEIEAERLSVHLLHRAGYPPEAAIRFWTHFGRRGLNFLTSPTHPGWRRRIALFEEEIAAIRAAEAAGIRPVPDFLSAASDSSRGVSQ